MRKNKLFKFHAMAILTALTLWGCQQPGNLEKNTARELTVIWDGQDGRTILPASYPKPTSYNLDLTSDSGKVVSKTDLTGTSLVVGDLDPAIYTIKITGFDTVGTVLASGSVSGVDTKNNKNATASVTLNYITSGTGTGGISLNLGLSSAPETVTGVTLSITDPSGKVTTPSLTSPYSYSNTSAAVGSWRFSYTVTTATKTARKVESVLVVQGGTTSGTISFASSDFNASYVKVTGVTVTGGSTVGLGHTISLTATAAPSGASYPDVTWSSSDTSVATVDSSGAVTGVAEGTATIAATSVDSGSLGTLSITTTGRWARSVSSGSGASFFRATATDSSGNVYAVGEMESGTYTFSTGVSAAGSSSGKNVAIVKYNASGIAQWSKSVTVGSSNSVFNAVASDSSGNVYAAGYITGNGTYTFASGVSATGPVSSKTNAVVVKYNSSGVVQWAQTLTGGSSDSEFKGIALDSTGNVIVAGTITGSGTYTFASGVTATGTSSSETNVVLVKYNASGVAQWAKSTVSGSGLSRYLSVAVDPSDDSIYAAGAVANDTYGFGNSVTAQGLSAIYNVLLVKYNSSGTAQWAKSVTSYSGYSLFNAVAVDGSGNVYAAGGTQGTTGFGNSVTTSGSSSVLGALLVKYNASGTAQWAKLASGSLDSELKGVRIDSAGNPFAAGSIKGSGTYTFATGVTTSAGYSGHNAVAVKYDSSGTAQWALSGSGNYESRFYGIGADGSGNVFAVGSIFGASEPYDFRSGVNTKGSGGSYNVVLVKYK